MGAPNLAPDGAIPGGMMASMADTGAEEITVTGIVQGVGFRPFVYRLATGLGLDGEVGNDAVSVFVTIAGPPTARDEFVRRVASDAPPLASVETVDRRPATTEPVPGFRIVASRAASGERTLVPPDTAVCDDCLRELFDPADRRHRHPFITCTNCGPRFTIIRSLPYDRPVTTMAGFEMCEACAAEYHDPADRRYHAQPIGCHDCGPRLTCTLPGDAVAATAGAIEGGKTVAVKGLGGYHLVCDATSGEAVARLRDRKQRPDKPFAVMVADLDAARLLAHVSQAEADLLASPARPIVLLRARGDSPLSSLVAPGNPLVGVMLPYTPVHHLLFAEGLGPIVCTSGNRGGEPIVYRDGDAEPVLGPLSDGILGHDRPIEVPCDDSVVRVLDGPDVAQRLLPVRRARGYAPIPVPVEGGQRSVLAVGGEMKSTCCVASPRHAWVSQHIGEQGTLATLDAFEAVVSQYTTMYGVEPDVVAVDAHPGYSTSQWARRTFPAVVEVQHHHAHVAAVMAEHGLDPHEPVVGVAFDGTGYGTDGTIWGGEVLLATADGFERVAHLAPVRLPGGDAAIANPYRVALAHLAAAGIEWDDDLAPVRSLAEDGPAARGVLERQLETGFSCVPTTSMGRLFDAAAALVGLRQRISFEAQAAIELELAAARAGRVDRRYRFTIEDGDALMADPAPVLHAVVRDLRDGVSVDEIAAGFHVAVVELVGDLVPRLRRDDQPVALSGGVFQNALLTEWCIERLGRDDVVPLTHHRVPPNDGGLALGQAFVAAHTPEHHRSEDQPEEET